MNEVPSEKYRKILFISEVEGTVLKKLSEIVGLPIGTKGGLFWKEYVR